MSAYPTPLDRLLTLGDPGWDESWRDYRQLGLGPEHVPELARMAADPALNHGDPDSPAVYAPVHAWRALGQLGGVEALPTLLGLLGQLEEEGDDYVATDFPRVFADLGPAVLSPLIAYLHDPTKGTYSRIAVAEALAKMAQQHPDQRPAVVEALTQPLAWEGEPDPAVNGFILSGLLELQAVEAAEAIEQAFAAGRIDETIAGDWPWVRYEFGLGPEPPRRQPLWNLPPPGGHSPRGRAEERKARRKRAKKARKRNRRQH
jgi:HEAT repeat protein